MPRIIDDLVKHQFGHVVVNVEQFNERVSDPDPVTGCMDWKGPGYHAQGYGMVMIWRASNGKRTMGLTHRLTYMMHVNSALQRTDFVIHTCSNPRCCNPKHLVLGRATDREQYRRANKGARAQPEKRRHLTKQLGRTYKYTDSQFVYAYYHTSSEIMDKYDLTNKGAYQLKFMSGPKGYPWVERLLSLYDTNGVLK